MLLEALQAIAKTNGVQPRRPAPAAFDGDGLAALVHPMEPFAGLDGGNHLRQRPHRFAPISASAADEAYSWGAMVEEMTPDSLCLTLCYPFPTGTCLTVELQDADGAVRPLAVRVVASEDKQGRLWRLHCELLPSFTESPFSSMPLQTQSV